MAAKKKPEKPSPAPKKKKPTKADQIRAVLKEHPDMPAAEVAKAAGTTVQNVHATRHHDRVKAGHKPQPRGKKPSGGGAGFVPKLDELRQLWEELKIANAIVGERIRRIEELIHG